MWIPGQAFTTGFLFTFPGAEKLWASGQILKTSLPFAFPQTGARWAPAQTFAVSLPFALQNRNNNRNKVNSQELSLEDTFLKMKQVLEKNIFIYLFGWAGSSLWHSGSLDAACKFLVASCGIQFSDQGTNSDPLHLEPGVLATGLPGKSPEDTFKKTIMAGRRAKPCLSKRSRGHIFPNLGTKETPHIHRKAPWGSKRSSHHPRVGDAKSPHRPLGWNPSWKKVVYVCWEGSQGRSSVEKDTR